MIFRQNIFNLKLSSGEVSAPLGFFDLSDRYVGIGWAVQFAGGRVGRVFSSRP